jgi:hypothetical protein
MNRVKIARMLKYYKHEKQLINYFKLTASSSRRNYNYNNVSIRAYY